MKIILKPIKWILSIIVGILIIPVIMLVLMYKSVTPPKIEQAKDLETIISEEVDEFLDETNDDKKLSIGLSSHMINAEIKNMLLEQIENENSSEEYVYEDENIKLQGVWVEYGQDRVNINIGVHVNARIMTYKTRILLSFDFKEINEDNDDIILKLSKISLGNLPLTWVANVAPTIMKTIMGIDVEELANDAVSDYGELDLKRRELKIDINKVSSLTGENKELIDLVLNLTLKNGLIQIGVDKSDDILGIKLDLNKIKDEAKLDIVLNKINSHEEFEMYLKSKALNSVLNGNHMISFNKKEINEVINFLFLGNDTEETLLKEVFFEDYEVIIEAPFIDISEKMNLIIPIKIGKPGSYFTSAINLGLDLKKNNQDLVFDFKTLNMGELSFDEDAIDSLLNTFKTDEINFVDKKFIVENFFEMFDMDGIEFTNVSVLDNKINFEYQSEHLDNIFEIISDLDSIAPEIKDAALEILDKINNNQDITDADVDEIIDLIDNLDEEEKQKIFDLINQYIE